MPHDTAPPPTTGRAVPTVDCYPPTAKAPRNLAPPLRVMLAQGDAGTESARAWLDAAVPTGVGLVYTDPPWNSAHATRFHRAARVESEPHGAERDPNPHSLSAGPTLWLDGEDAHPDITILRGPKAPEDFHTPRDAFLSCLDGIAETVAHATRPVDEAPPGLVVVETGLPQREAIRAAFERDGVVLPHTFPARYGGAADGARTPMLVMVGWNTAPGHDVGRLAPRTVALLRWACEAYRGVSMTSAILGVLLCDPAVRAAMAHRPAVLDPCVGLGMTFRALDAAIRGHGLASGTPGVRGPLPLPAFVGVEAVPSRLVSTLGAVRMHATRTPRKVDAIAHTTGNGADVTLARIAKQGARVHAETP